MSVNLLMHEMGHVATGLAHGAVRATITLHTDGSMSTRHDWPDPDKVDPLVVLACHIGGYHHMDGIDSPEDRLVLRMVAVCMDRAEQKAILNLLTQSRPVFEELTGNESSLQSIHETLQRDGAVAFEFQHEQITLH